ncbi:MAG: hypothetical protein EA424_09340 [Planctomycetaceae bacterium]|nr:MAG: hypothetical protein EA424_09340 [Planctomycetaceae bacterium]
MLDARWTWTGSLVRRDDRLVDGLQFTLQPLAFQLGCVQTLFDLFHLLLPPPLELLTLVARHISLAAHLLHQLVHFSESGL